jgi:hypothetical protein
MENKLPEHIREMLLRIGEVEWCGFEPASAEQLGKCFQAMVENTNQNHGLEGDQMCSWVSTKDRLSIAMVGTSPNSGVIASIIAAGWNYMVEAARAEEGE